MADNVVVRNGNLAPFVPFEAPVDSNEADLTPGHMAERTSAGDYQRKTGEISLDTEAPGRGLVARVNETDPADDRDTKYPSGERAQFYHVPIGGAFDGFVEAGGDLSDSTLANVTEGDVLVEGPQGGLHVHPGISTTGDGTGTATEDVYDHGALYEAQESVDNSAAAAGVDNQVRIRVRRIA